jgi:flagellar protein FlbD
VILLTRLGGPVFALNPDLFERCDCTPDTVITLVDGKKYLVAESLPEVISLIRQYRATVIADAQHMTGETPVTAPHHRNAPRTTDGHQTLHDTDTDAEPTNVVQLHPRER